MPTAPDNAVFIRWTRIEYLGMGEDLRHIWKTDCIVNVAGELVSTVKVWTNSTITDFEGKLNSALEEKRLEYVTP